MNAVGAGLLGTMAGVAPCVDIGLTGSRARLAGAPVCRWLDRRPCSVDRTSPGTARAGKTLPDRRGGPKGRAHSQVRFAAGAEGWWSRGRHDVSRSRRRGSTASVSAYLGRRYTRSCDCDL
jgi:hypothetical protein